METPVIEIETKNDEDKNKKENFSKSVSKTMNKIVNNNENKNENKESKFVEYNKKLYQIEFSKKMNHIKIKCNDANNSNDIYKKKLFFDECKQSNKYFEFLGNISTIFDVIKKAKNNIFMIKSQDNSLILKINFEYLEQKYPLNILLQKEEDLIKIIEKLKNENAILKIRLEDKDKIINRFISNINYNLYFDDTLYILDDVYDTITHDIIQKKEDLGLINWGIKNIFSKNIKYCILKYKFSTDSKKPSIFLESISSIINLLIVLITTKNKRFGVFFQNNNSNLRDGNNANSYCGNCNEKMKNSIKRLFYTCCKKGKSFSFSLDNFKIYEKSNQNPNFNIKYDFDKECLFGNEFILMKEPEIQQSINNNNHNHNDKFIREHNILFGINPKEFKTISYSSFVLHGQDRNSEYNIADLERGVLKKILK